MYKFKIESDIYVYDFTCSKKVLNKQQNTEELERYGEI